MKASFRITDEGRAALRVLGQSGSLTHAEEVKALMDKGLKIVIASGHAVWAHAPRKIAAACGASYIAALPAADDVAEYMGLAGEIVTVH